MRAVGKTCPVVQNANPKEFTPYVYSLQWKRIYNPVSLDLLPLE